MKRTFTVYQHITKATAGKPTEYKVIMKCGKESLTLLGDEQSLFKEYPKGHEFQVTISKEQQTF